MNVEHIFMEYNFVFAGATKTDRVVQAINAKTESLMQYTASLVKLSEMNTSKCNIERAQ